MAFLISLPQIIAAFQTHNKSIPCREGIVGCRSLSETRGVGWVGALGVDIYKFNVLHVPRLQPVFGQQNHLAVPLFHLLSPGGSWIRSLLRYHELTPFRLDLTENGSANTRNSADESSFYFNFIKHKQFYATLVCRWLFQM